MYPLYLLEKESMNDLDNPYLGFGLGLRHCHFNYIMEHRPPVDWFEALSENYLSTEGSAKRHLLQISSLYPIVLHGVSMSIGSYDPIDKNYLKKLKQLSLETGAVLISDHLCWTGVMGVNTHDLLPLPYTEEALKVCVEKVLHVQDFLGRKIYIENPSSYMSFKSSVLAEWQFMNYLAKESGCGILLDVNNVFVNSYNHGFDPLTYLSRIDLESVGYIHLAGHTKRNGYLLDSHIGPVPNQVWDLYKHLMGLVGNRSTLIEWDDEIPDFSVLTRELKKAKSIASRGARKPRDHAKENHI